MSELTIEQEFALTVFSNAVDNASSEQLVELILKENALLAARQDAYKNIFKEILTAVTTDCGEIDLPGLIELSTIPSPKDIPLVDPEALSVFALNREVLQNLAIACRRASYQQERNMRTAMKVRLGIDTPIASHGI